MTTLPIGVNPEKPFYLLHVTGGGSCHVGHIGNPDQWPFERCLDAPDVIPAGSCYFDKYSEEPEQRMICRDMA